MKPKLLRTGIVAIFIVYAYLFGWQIYYFNESPFYSQSLRDALGSFFRYMPAFILLLYGILVYANLVLQQRRMLVFSSFFAAALLLFYDNIQSVLMAVLLSVFGLCLTFKELASAKEVDPEI